MNGFNHHVYLISYIDSLDGPIKIGYSNHPPTRLKQLQTGNPKKLVIYGNLAFKDEFAARAVEKIILSYLIDNNVNAKGEWYNIDVNLGLQILNFFPHNREKLDKPLEFKDEKIINLVDLINYGVNKEIINDEEYDRLREIYFETDDGDRECEFTNFIKESKNDN